MSSSRRMLLRPLFFITAMMVVTAYTLPWLLFSGETQFVSHGFIIQNSALRYCIAQFGVLLVPGALIILHIYAKYEHWGEIALAWTTKGIYLAAFITLVTFVVPRDSLTYDPHPIQLLNVGDMDVVLRPCSADFVGPDDYLTARMVRLERPVFAGAMTEYRSLLKIPQNKDVSIKFVPPGKTIRIFASASGGYDEVIREFEPKWTVELAPVVQTPPPARTSIEVGK